VVRHPLFLIAAGALVSGLLVPTLTRGAQDHKEALEIKSDLVTSVSEATNPFLAATLANILAHRGTIPKSYDKAYEEWYARGSVVAAKLQTYYPGHEVTQRWWGLTNRMRDIYYFFRLSTDDARRSGARLAYVDRLETFIGNLSTCKQPGGGVPCPMVDFPTIDRWLAKPQRRWDDQVNFFMEELLLAFKTELNEITSLILDGDPRL
jgi:hypothetical protein